MTKITRLISVISVILFLIALKNKFRQPLTCELTGINPSRLKNLNYCYYCNLTHLSLASLLWDIGKQNSPKCDAAKRGVPSGAGYSICLENFHRKKK